MKIAHQTSFVLVVVGALNWGLVGLFNFNLVSYLFGSMPMVEMFVYLLVGVAGLALLFTHKDTCCACSDNCECKVPTPAMAPKMTSAKRATKKTAKRRK